MGMLAFVKGGIGAKIALVVLGLALGVGGITAGARLHAARQSVGVSQRLVIGRITAINGDAIAVRPLGAKASVPVTILPRTILRHAGKPIALGDLHVGDTVLLRVARRNGVIIAISVGQIKRAPTTAGP